MIHKKTVDKKLENLLKIKLDPEINPDLVIDRIKWTNAANLI
jgi:hypothetical protein